jgi:hypothetical protein
MGREESSMPAVQTALLDHRGKDNGIKIEG